MNKTQITTINKIYKTIFFSFSFYFLFFCFILLRSGFFFQL